MKILFMCVANSARSQLAEGLAQKIFGSEVEIQSAGSHPKEVNPYAIMVLKEVGIDISTNTSKSVDQLAPQFLAGLDYVITLCAEEVCPTLVAPTAKRRHWPFPDPAGRVGSTMDRVSGNGTESAEEYLEKFRRVRDGIETKLKFFKAEIKI